MLLRGPSAGFAQTRVTQSYKFSRGDTLSSRSGRCAPADKPACLRTTWSEPSTADLKCAWRNACRPDHHMILFSLYSHSGLSAGIIDLIKLFLVFFNGSDPPGWCYSTDRTQVTQLRCFRSCFTPVTSWRRVCCSVTAAADAEEPSCQYIQLQETNGSY